MSNRSAALPKVTKEQLEELLTGIKREFFEVYNDKSTLSKVTTVTKLQGSTPCQELTKLATLMKAHTTKLGLVCNPDKFYENHTSVSTELQEFCKLLFYMISLRPVFSEDESIPEYFIENVDTDIWDLIQSFNEFITDVEKMLKLEKEIVKQNKSNNENRLVIIGKIWSSCDKLILCSEKGTFGILGDSIKADCSMLVDVVDEINDWLEDPDFEENDEDPLCGFTGLSITDAGTDPEKDIKDKSVEAKDAEEKKAEKLKEISPFLTNYLNVIKLINLLFKSFRKSLSSKDFKPNQIKATSLDGIYQLGKDICACVDDTISTVLFDPQNFSAQEMLPDLELLSKLIKNTLVILEGMYKNDTMRTKWVLTWKLKYFEHTSPVSLKEQAK